eukprot:CAMPEP_0119087744 /NCGR_PEP_ID=MMETSP1178-20130426/142909_1 /TAXON_ID=33656 /ORGANISM="unid sp, Strain CCMP2000" /LENGTH=171 /DNA_ID=CAMNT_0007070977 /DNA_START=131 /DNA_END=646 /DNA_ORIENTATION=+
MATRQLTSLGRPAAAMCSLPGSIRPLGLQSSFKPLSASSLSSAFELFNKFNTAFVAFDLDGDGTISVSELTLATRRLGQQVSEAEVAQLISEYDLNDNGSIDFDEFCELMTREARGAPIEAIREAARQVVEPAVSPAPSVSPTPEPPAPHGLEGLWWGDDSSNRGPTLHTA